ncbi:hypothetical protein JAAARDRAFT_203451, partial [Jaapia argillacea MUCL 33604]
MMPETRSSSKRRRTMDGSVDADVTISESSQPAQNPTVVKSDTIWFFDGNIVLQATDEAEHTQHLFKCHKSILAKHSSIFDDVFGLPQSQESSEQFEGVPLVRLPDSADDLRDLLELLYDPIRIPHEKHAAETVGNVAGVLRLATKYDIAPLRQRLIEVLERDWSRTLRGWDQNISEIDELMLSKQGGNFDDFLPEPASLIRLAQECKVPSVLTSAYYQLCRVYDSRTPEDEEKRFAEIDLLSASDLRRFIKGREALRLEIRRFLVSISSNKRPAASITCNLSPGKNKDGHTIWGCKTKLRQWVTSTAFDELCGTMSDDPLSRMSVMVRKAGNLSDKEVCVNCRIWLSQTIRTKREELWLALGDYFEVDDFDDGEVEIVEEQEVEA